MAVQCARFFDCQSHFTTRSVSLLQRCLASNTSKERMAFFHEIKCCRRRAQKIAIADTALARVLLKEEELEVMYQRAVASRIKATLAGLNMGVADAFVSFDGEVYVQKSVFAERRRASKSTWSRRCDADQHRVVGVMLSNMESAV